MLLRDIVPCRCLARTHLQGQQLDMCKGQSSRSSFVEAGRAVPFAVDVVRFVMIKSVSAVASEWIRLQVSMGNQPTNQPASQPTNHPLKQSNCRSSEALPHAVPCTYKDRTKTLTSTRQGWRQHAKVALPDTASRTTAAQPQTHPSAPPTPPH